MTRSVPKAERGPLVVIGTGGRAYREYALAGVARAADQRGRPIVALVPEPATWQRERVSECRLVDVGDPDAVLAQLRTLPTAPAGVLTWDETALESTAAVADELGLPHMSRDAVSACRDKLLTRRALAAARVPVPRFHHVLQPGDAPAAAAHLAQAVGWPIVVKPRALAGSVGVTLVRDAAELPEACGLAARATVPKLSARDGLLIEEFVDGPELSIDSVIFNGTVTLAVVARKVLGFAPYFEEIGHRVLPWRHESWAAAVTDVVVAAHRALAIRTGITHTEVRLTRSGPKIIEVNGRLGGDLIPYLGQLATGIDLPAAAVAIALGEAPHLQSTGSRCAAVSFRYPPTDVRVKSVEVASAGDRPPWLDRMAVLAEPGDTLFLPPRGMIPRYAAVIVTGGSERECDERLYQAGRQLCLSYDPLDAAVPAPSPPASR